MRPVGLALAVAVLATTVWTGSLAGPSSATRAALGLHVRGLFEEGRVAELLTSVLVASGPVELVAVLAALVLVVGGVERQLGHRRVLLLWLATATAGGLVGTALQAAGLLARGVWTTPPAALAVLHPETPLLGVLFAASAFAGPLWRRRVRTIGATALIVLLLYSGQPEDLDHLAGAIAGLVLGVLATRRAPRLVFPRSSHHEARTLLAAVVAVTALGPVVAVLQPTGYGLLRPLGRLFRDPLPAAQHAHDRCAVLSSADCVAAARLAHLNGPGALLLAVLPLLVLVVAALLIQRGRVLGAWIAAGTSALLALLAALSGVLPAAAIGQGWSPTLQALLAIAVPLAVAILALRGARHCPVRPSRPVLVTAAVAVVAGTLAGTAAYVVVGSLVPDQFAPRATPSLLVASAPERFVPTGFLRRHAEPVPVGPIAAALTGWSGTAAWLVLLGAAVAAGASSDRAVGLRDHARLRALLRRGAGGSLGWITTWPGNRVWFSPDGAHAVAYRDAAGVALTAGEPVGPEEGAVEAARAFALHCDDLGLVPAFYSVRPGFADRLGDQVAWATVEVGEDTVIDPAAFTLSGRRVRDVRASVNRADRLGLRATWTTWAALPLSQRAQLEAISEAWMADRRLPEMGFTTGSMAETTDPEVRLMLAQGPGDRIDAVTSWLPTWRDGRLTGWTLDIMRRRADAPNGVVEFLIAAVIARAQCEGLDAVSLSVAPLAGASDEGDRLQRLLAGVARTLDPVYGFRSLAAFKDKFRPEHVPQVVAVPDAVALPVVAVAIARAHLPGLSLPVVRRLVGALRSDPSGERATLRPAPGHG